MDTWDQLQPRFPARPSALFSSPTHLHETRCLCGNHLRVARPFGEDQGGTKSLAHGSPTGFPLLFPTLCLSCCLSPLLLIDAVDRGGYMAWLRISPPSHLNPENECASHDEPTNTLSKMIIDPQDPAWSWLRSVKALLTELVMLIFIRIAGRKRVTVFVA